MYVHVHTTCLYMYMYIYNCIMYIHVYDLICLYVHGTYTFMNVNICMGTVQTRLYSFTNTLHFPSGPIRLATPASLSSAQEPLLLSREGAGFSANSILLGQLVKTCMYIVYTCTYGVYTCTYIVHGYHVLYACTTTVYANVFSPVQPLKEVCTML